MPARYAWELVEQIAKLAETVPCHDEQIKAIVEEIQKMLQKPPEPPKGRIGFESPATVKGNSSWPDSNPPSGVGSAIFLRSGSKRIHAVPVFPPTPASSKMPR
jgi:hypothetical protein